MADLGTVPVATVLHSNPAGIIPTHYRINRGLHLGPLPTTIIPIRTPVLHGIGNYIVRMIRVVYRQLWPNHGQRFPQ